MRHGLQRRLSPPRTLLGIDGVYDRYCALGARLASLFPTGTPVYEREWDVLVVLDACRVDVMEEVRDEFAFLGDPATHTSVGSSSEQWLSRTFTEAYADEMAETVHVTGNPYTDENLSADRFRLLDEVWRYGWDDGLGTLPPRHVTDRAVTHIREHSPDRAIVHYMQPHYPFVPARSFGAKIEIEKFGNLDGDTVWDRLRKGEIDVEPVWEAYRENLRYVLEEVELLLRSIDADSVVISADHGNAFGEFGQYGHRPWLPISCHREVPWYRTSATDTGEYEPSFERSTRTTPAVEDKLEDLGYL